MHRLTFTMEGKTLVVAREGDPASLRIDLLSLEPNTRHTMDFKILPEENRQLFMLEHLPDLSTYAKARANLERFL